MVQPSFNIFFFEVGGGTLMLFNGLSPREVATRCKCCLGGSGWSQSQHCAVRDDQVTKQRVPLAQCELSIKATGWCARQPTRQCARARGVPQSSPGRETRAVVTRAPSPVRAHFRERAVSATLSKHTPGPWFHFASSAHTRSGSRRRRASHHRGSGRGMPETRGRTLPSVPHPFCVSGPWLCSTIGTGRLEWAEGPSSEGRTSPISLQEPSTALTLPLDKNLYTTHPRINDKQSCRTAASQQEKMYHSAQSFCRIKCGDIFDSPFDNLQSSVRAKFG